MNCLHVRAQVDEPDLFTFVDYSCIRLDMVVPEQQVLCLGVSAAAAASPKRIAAVLFAAIISAMMSRLSPTLFFVCMRSLIMKAALASSRETELMSMMTMDNLRRIDMLLNIRITLTFPC
jgi:hypothetical protein